MNQCDVVLRNPVRTAIGTDGSKLKEEPAPDLGAAAICDTLKRPRLVTWRMYLMRRHGLNPDVVTPCISGGQGSALALESI